MTDREAAVLRLLVEDKTSQEIAAALVISAKTVKRHLDNIFPAWACPHAQPLPPSPCGPAWSERGLQRIGLLRQGGDVRTYAAAGNDTSAMASFIVVASTA